MRLQNWFFKRQNPFRPISMIQNFSRFLFFSSPWQKITGVAIKIPKLGSMWIGAKFQVIPDFGAENVRSLQNRFRLKWLI